MCVYVCACMYLCVFACASVQTGVRVRGCARVRVCMHVHVRKWVSVRVPFLFLFLHHLRLETFSWVDLHALGATLLILKLQCFCTAAEPLAVKPLGAVEPYEGLPSMRDTALPPNKMLKFCLKAGASEFCGLEGQRKVVFEHSFRPYIYVYIRPAESHLRSYGYSERIFIRVYIC
jgi:hypothetical protein